MTKIKIEKLPASFMGRAETRGFAFEIIVETDLGFIYKVDTDGSTHFEVFKYKLTPVCIDFANRIYAENEFKIHYPKQNSFGVWAWTTKTLQRAQEILNTFIKDVETES